MSDSACVVCYRDVKYYSVGLCEHSVCFECSVRMRVLLEQNECPICRQILDQVIFTRGKKSYRDVRDKLRMFIMIPRYGIYVEDEDIKDDYEALLEHRCFICKSEPPFKDFKELRLHVQKTHELYSCDLCAEHIKQFTQERRFYTRGDLAYHKRKGDRDDKSHRGHPLCQFCDRRYFDQDELFKHLRMDHYFCHFCDADGLNVYYDTYDDLRIHFRKEHFLCEEEDCKEEKFTSVFRTEIDLKAHLTTAHSRLLGKHGTKQARVLDLEFSYGPRSDDERRSRRFRDGPRSGPQRNRDARDNPDTNEPIFVRETPPPPPKVNTESVQDFPTLEGATPAAVLPVTTNAVGGSSNSSIAQRLALKSGLNVSTSVSAPGKPNWNAKVSGASKLDEEFPALGGPVLVTSAPSSYAPSSSSSRSTSHHHHQPKSFMKVAAVGGQPIPATHHHQQKANYKSKSVTNGFGDEEFPSLGDTSRGANGAWTGSGPGVKMKPVPRMKKVAAAPDLGRKVEVDTSDDFHFVPLSVSRARRDSLSEKFDLKEETALESSSTNKDKTKKKKKNREKDDNSNNMQLNAASIFTGGSLGHVEGGASSIRNTDEDFPSLQSIRSSLPTSTRRGYY